jgi:hypothetical protein
MSVKGVTDDGRCQSSSIKFMENWTFALTAFCPECAIPSDHSNHDKKSNLGQKSNAQGNDRLEYIGAG